MECNMLDNLISLSSFTDTQRAEALEKFHILQPFLEEGVPLTTIAQSREISLRTLQRWTKHYRENGLKGLVHKNRSDYGNRRIPEQVRLLVEGLILKKPTPSIASIHRQIIKLSKEHGWKAPSYSCIYDIVSNISPAMKPLAHEGVKKYKEAFDIIHRREANTPNEIWQADHTLLDIWLINEKGQPARPWLTIILDDYSRAVVGYFLSFQAPSAIQTALALHQAIWRKTDSRWCICGIPEYFYTDHGSDFTSQHMEQVSADLKMRLIFSTIGMPRGRGKIERFFQTINQLFLHQLPGYINKQKSSINPSLTLSELDIQFREFLFSEYHIRPHGTTGIPPQERWEQNGFLPQMPETLEDLDLLLLHVAKSRHVRSDGIRFQGLRYTDATLAAYVGEEVIIRYNPRDIAEIRVFHQ